METVTVRDILTNYNISYEKKIKTCQYLNDYLCFGVNHFNGSEDFIKYLLFAIPENILEELNVKYNAFSVEIINLNRKIEISLEHIYRCLHNDESAICGIAAIFNYLFGSFDMISKDFEDYIRDFNNWKSDRWLLFVAENCI